MFELNNIEILHTWCVIAALMQFDFKCFFVVSRIATLNTVDCVLGVHQKILSNAFQCWMTNISFKQHTIVIHWHVLPFCRSMSSISEFFMFASRSRNFLAILRRWKSASISCFVRGMRKRKQQHSIMAVFEKSVEFVWFLKFLDLYTKLMLKTPLKPKKIKCHTRKPPKLVSVSSHSGSLMASPMKFSIIQCAFFVFKTTIWKRNYCVHFGTIPTN